MRRRNDHVTIYRYAIRLARLRCTVRQINLSYSYANVACVVNIHDTHKRYIHKYIHSTGELLVTVVNIAS